MKTFKVKRYSKQGGRWFLWDVQLIQLSNMPKKRTTIFKDPDTKQLCKDVVHALR